MKRLPLILFLLFVAVIIGASWMSVRLWRQQQHTAAVLKGIPKIPNLVRWPGQMVREVHATTDRVRRAQDPVKTLGRLAEIYHVNGFEAEAKQALLSLRELDPSNARWPYFLADGFLVDGDTVAAEAALRATIALEPQYSAAWLRLGDLYVERGAFAQAEKAYTEAMQVSPNDVSAEFALITFRARHGKGGEPRRDLEELARANPEIKELHELLSQLHRAAGDEAQAAAELKLAAACTQNIETLDPWLDELSALFFDPNRLGLKAARLTRERRFAEAETLLTRAIELSPADATLLRTLSELYQKMDRPADARRVLEAGVRECRDDPKMPELLSQLLCADRKPDEALAVATRALERWPKSGDLRAARGLALREARRFEEALAELREAAALNPLQVEVDYNMALCWLALNQRDAAKASAEHALLIRPNYSEALALLGGLALDAQDVEAADRYITRLFGLRYDEPGARLLFAALNLMKGTRADDAGHLDDAAEYLHRGLEVAPDVGPLLRKSGSVAMKRGAFDEAVVTLEKYIKLERNDAAAYAWLGEALIETGKRAEARKVLEAGYALAQKAGDQSQADEFSLLLQRTRR